MTPIKEVIRIKESISEQILCQEDYACTESANGAFLCLSDFQRY